MWPAGRFTRPAASTRPCGAVARLLLLERHGGLCLFGVLSPLGRLVEAELQDKLEDTVTLSWQELRASDLSGRARAFQSMVGGGMAVAEAVSVAGLMVED